MNRNLANNTVVRRRGRGRGRIVTARQVIRHERRLMVGTDLRGMPSDPPRVEIAPWFSMTLVFYTTLSAASPDVVSVNDTFDMLRVQLGLPATVSNDVWRIRYQKFRVWADGTASTSSAAPLGLLLEPFSLIGEGYQRKIQDWSGEVAYAKCGWDYPSPQKLVVFTADGATANQQIVARVSVSRGTTVPVIYYIDVLWSTNTTIINLLPNESSVVSSFASLAV